MKLTSHQKKIVDKIIDGEVFDIASYLKVFAKGHTQQYDPEDLQRTFLECEKGMTYVFKEDDHNFYTYVYNNAGQECDKILIKDQMTYQLKDYPLESPVHAQLELRIRPEGVTYKEQTFAFNFLDKAYLVADSFLAIKDFVALWSYLRREALVFEGSKPVDEDDLSIFFEQVEQEIHPITKPKWDQKVDIDETTKGSSIQKVNISMVPQKSANNYIKKAWKINQDNLAMCEGYIGIKMMATSDLINFRQKGYRTVEEISQHKNLCAAWAAVIISLVSVFIGNILPLFQKTETDYLDSISQQVTSIEERIYRDAGNEDVISALAKIQEALIVLSESESKTTPEELKNAIDSLTAEINELNQLIDANQP